MSSGTDTNQNVEFTGILSRSTTTDKGYIHINDGNGVFKLLKPTSDGQILTSNSLAPYGAEWSLANVGIGFGIPSGEFIPIPSSSGGVTFFLSYRKLDNSPNCVVLPSCSWVLFSITPNRGSGTDDGWSTTPANITGGFLDFYYGYIDASTAPTSANFKYYATGTTTPPITSDFQISGLVIKTDNFRSFTDTVGYNIVSGQQVCIRLVNNLTTSASPTLHSFQCISIFKTM